MPRQSIGCTLFLTCFFALTFTSMKALSQHVQQADSTAVKLIKPVSQSRQNFSGDRQFARAETVLEAPLRVRVVKNDSVPVAGWPVHFSLVSAPSGAKGYSIAPKQVYTDSAGFAETSVTLGSKAGTYNIAAKINNGSANHDIVFFQATARESSWVFFLVIGLAGGLGMFLYGMKLMSDGMKKTAGDRMRSILSKLTTNRFIALGVGAFVTMVIQSSSATTVMLVSFVQAQLMTFAQSFGIILGANIGTTITAQLVAFKLTDYAPLMISLGILLMFMSKKEKVQNIGETTLGFGLLFFGMHMMSQSMYPLITYTPFIELLITLENPILGILVGAIFTALIQSSSAFTGILIVLAVQGLLTLEAGIPLIFGANIGTCITAGLAALNASRDAKRVALAHTLFQIAGVILFIWWIPSFAEIIRSVSPKGSADLTGVAQLAQVVPRQVANAHTIFNIATAIVVLPFLPLAAKIVMRILPHKEEVPQQRFRTKFLDNSLLSTPSLALSLAKAEVLHMGELARNMVNSIIKPFLERDSQVLAEIDGMEEEVNFLEEKISDFVAKISRLSVAQDQIDEAFQIMYSVAEFEQIADIVSKNLYPRAKEWLGDHRQFSKAGRKEIVEFHARTIKQIDRAINTFKDSDLKQAAKMKRKYKKHRSMEDSLRRTHYERLRSDIPETVQTSEYHQDLMEQFRRIAAHATNIARILLEWSEENNKTVNANQ